MTRFVRRAGPPAAVVLMVAFGCAVYLSLGWTRSPLTRRPESPPPPSARASLSVPGTMYLVQGGALYSFRGGAFIQLGQPAGWSQPSASPDGSALVAVKRAFNVSDLYLLRLDGSVQRQLTHNGSRIVEVNQWAFYPRYSSDGAELFFSRDWPKDYDYRVDLALWAMPAGGGAPRQWTRPDHYSGGDVQPEPVPSGGVIYTKFSVDATGTSVPQVMFAAAPLDPPAPLTEPSEHCQMPRLSPDATQLAMICQRAAGSIQLVVAPFANRSLGARDVYVEGGLITGAAWAPDGMSLAYLAPGAEDPGGGFQLWWVGVNAPPRQLSTGLAFDALSPPVWLR